MVLVLWITLTDHNFSISARRDEVWKVKEIVKKQVISLDLHSVSLQIQTRKRNGFDVHYFDKPQFFYMHQKKVSLKWNEMVRKQLNFSDSCPMIKASSSW